MSATIEEALGQAREIDGDFRDFYDKVNSVIDWVPAPLEHLIRPILDGLEWLGERIKEFWDSVADFLDNTGSPSKLEAHAQVLFDSVAKPLETISGDIALDKLPSHIEWTGSGATAYHTIVPKQEKNASDLKDLATDLGNTLKELANGIENFWIAMGFAFGALIVGAVAAIVEACTVVGIPLAIATICAAIGVAIAAIGAAVIEIKTIYDTIDTSQDKIEQGLVDVGEAWAQATPDAQAKMEDPGEWKPQ
jgi:uncharacterized protein YukE